MSQKEQYIDLVVTADKSTNKIIGIRTDFMGSSHESIQKFFGGSFPEVDSSIHGDREWCNWGKDNRLPTRKRMHLNQVNMAASTLKRLVDMKYGMGLMIRPVEGAERVAEKKVVQRFLRRNRIQEKWLPAQIYDFTLYGNSFSEIGFSLGNEISQLYHKPAEFSRLALMDKETARIEKLYFSPEFYQGYPHDDRILDLPLFQWDISDLFITTLRARGLYNFAWHSCLPSPGVVYYGTPANTALFKKGGWMEVAGDVPGILVAMQRNQVLINYIIRIPVSYFYLNYGRDKWIEMSSQARKNAYEDTVKAIEQKLIGIDNQYTTISQQFNDEEGFPEGKILIEPIDNTKIASTAWIPNSNEADKQISLGMGLDPSQNGLNGAGQLITSNGTDKRESFNTAIQNAAMECRILLEPLNWIFEYNNWGWEAYIGYQAHTTKDKSDTGLEKKSTENE